MTLPESSAVDDVWWRDYFDDLYTEVYDHLRGRDWIARDVDAMHSLFAQYCHGADADVLDAPCGSGKHSLELVRRGHSVVGVDNAPTTVARARRSAAAERLHGVEFECADLRTWRATRAFDAAVNWCTCLGYTLDPGDDVALLHSTLLALRPGGVLLLECEHLDNMLANWVPDVSVETGDIQLDMSRTVVDGVYRDRQRLVRGDTVDERSFTFRVYTGDELVELCVRAGFEVDDLLIGVSPGMVAGDDRAVVVARRP